jgi:hypothetical protein
MKKKKTTSKRSAKTGSKSDQNKSKGKRKITIGFYALAFIDVLSQRDKLSKITAFPDNDEQTDTFFEQWRETFGVIDEYRTMFSKFFDTFSSYKPSKIPQLKPEQAKMLERLMKSEIKEQLFSDSMIYYVPLMETPDRLNISSIHNLLSGCAGTFLIGLAEKIICRGGIDVGIAGEFFRGEIYGPALYQAYHLESERAQFPRIVVGDEFCKYLVSEMNWPGDSVDAKHRRMWAKDCADWIMTDVDGAQVLDYAGPVTKRIFPKLQSSVDLALTFASEEWQKFRALGNAKLAGRYYMLCSYLATRREQVWK